jgi:zinc/manganese transport system permease protein
MLEILALPFAACLVLAAMHVYLGFHVLARGIIFVDLALAQVAALGLTVAILAGHAPGSDAAYGYALAFALAGAALLASLPLRRAAVAQEAVIGIVYAVSAALAILVVDRAPQGAELIKQLMVGSLLTVAPGDVATLAIVYAAIGAALFATRRPMIALSLDPAGGSRAYAWDLFFYATFAIVVTSSVRVAGVLVVFAFLVVPAAIGALLAGGVRGRLVVGWIAGAIASLGGLAASWAWDLPTGAAVVAAFGASIAMVALAIGVVRGIRAVRAGGVRSLAPALVAIGIGLVLAGASLAAFPRMDHLWLDALERAVPSLQVAFLSDRQREARADAIESIGGAGTELSRLRRTEEEVRWGERAMEPEKYERLRQYVASRAEIAAGDTLLLRSLRTSARERQRFWVGLPLVAAGCGLIALGMRARVRAK